MTDHDAEPRVSIPVLSLLTDIRVELANLAKNMDARFDQIRSALDERVTNAVFEALRADMSVLAKRQRDLEDRYRAEQNHKRGVVDTLKEFRGFVGWLVATAIAVAWLLVAIKHG